MKTYNYIYLTTNLINGKIYVGKHSTDNLNDDYYGSGHILKRAINKYGISNFKKEILAFADTEKTLNFLERFYIRKYKSQDKSIGYNVTFGGAGGSIKGRIKSPEECKHISQSKIGDKNPMYGKTGYWTGKHRSEETKQKLSEALKGRPGNWTGRHHSEESRKKMSEAKKGKTPWNKGLKKSQII